ncbi:MAG: GtrA family protein [Prevotella sp.]|nr:GtrA family protein [Prevotella sp.]
MRELLRTFKISREERWLALVALVVFILLNALTIYKYGDLFMQPVDDYWKLFIGRFRVSGYDPITYYVLSDWETRYNVYRHPLLAFFMYLPYLLNQGVLSLTGLNGVQLVTAMILVTASLYSFLFLNRIFREIVGLAKRDALLLSTLCFSFAYIMVATMVPDHFILSMMMLLLTLYVAGRQIKEGRQMSRSQTIWLFIFTAGISLNNGIKVFLANLFVNGKRFFHPMNLLLAVIIPAALMWLFCRWEYKTFVLENEKARHAQKKQEREEKRQKERVLKLEAARKDSIRRAQGDTTTAAPVAKPVVKKRTPHTGKPIGKGEFMRWTDITTSRWDTTVENLFGESLQLHEQHLLGDVFRRRPIIVRYDHWWNYAAEAVAVLLFFIGIWCGRRSRFLWLTLSFLAVDMALHMGLGFGINEIYIMSPHYLFALPIAMGYLLLTKHRWLRLTGRVLILLLTVYLWVHNGYLLTQYMLT